ncbi:TolA protein [Moritella sp. JT01]|uniref:choice-of-anchor Q domain-containing protein n=1 Tax=Moritella sp. JT01 TaxID=756698 RepID=UPI000794C3B8|nr:choice-of-anchor Q domain-containing protein [Moritella sp. JT01]KXO12486.1 TolA protein [Moritella sp. JT01]
MNSSLRYVTYCIFIIILSKTSAVWAFNYPVGIPDAWISPDIAAPLSPSPWTSEITNMYYINGSDSKCSAKVTYGTITEPRCSFPSLLPSGSYVEVHGGPYTYTNTAYLHSEGTKSKPVWVIGAKDNLIKMHLVLSGTYLYLDGFNIEGDKGISARPYQDRQTDHIMVRNTVITGSGSFSVGTTGINANGLSGLQFEGFIAYKNTISYMGDSEIAAENDRHALTTGSYINDVWHLYNTTHHNGGDGVQYSHSGVDSHHFYYGGNTSYDEGENCVDIKQANDVIISQNTCSNIESSSSSQGSCMVVHYEPNRIWFINNNISECVYGINSSGASELHVIGNNIHGMREISGEKHPDISTYQSGVGFMAYNTGNTYISNNTITDAVHGIAYQTLPGFEVDITGNIIANLRNGEFSGNNAYAIILKGDDIAVANSDIENSLFYNPIRIYVDGLIHTELATLVLSGKCNDSVNSCVTQNPSFYKDGHTLTLGSPAINTGILSSSYAVFKNLYGKEITTDILGNNRPHDGEWDIGAYEYIGRDDTPKAPSGISIKTLDP